MLLTHALALSASQLVHKKKSQRIYTSMHSAGLELTKLIYTRLEDNLIRHRGDRLHQAPACELKYLSDFGSFWYRWLASSTSQKHLVSRFWLPTNAGWRTRRRHTPHQEPPSISRAVVACGEL